MTMMSKVATLFCFASTAAAATITRQEKAEALHQDGIVLNAKGAAMRKEAPTTIRRKAIAIKAVDVKHTNIDELVVPMSAVETRGVGICADVASEHTGFDVNDDTGFVKHASCDDLAQHCHDKEIGEQVRVSCPISCFICTPGTNGGDAQWIGPCYDAVNTGIRFRDGPKAQCADLINYCNHTAIGGQVKEACKLSCGQCQLHVEGPYVDAYGNCADLASHEEPEFTIDGQMAGCADMQQFCQNHPDSYLIRHKCPLTCGVCGNAAPTTTPNPYEVKIPGDTAGCDRRRRWGFCSTRRRRNV